MDSIDIKEELALQAANKETDISLTSRGYFNVLYHNPAGITIMTGCLGIYFISYLISEKIMTIEMDG